MMKSAIDGGMTEQSVVVLERLTDLHLKLLDRDAKKEFDTAFSELQRETPKIQALKGVPDKSGNIKYTYAPFEAIMEQVQPLLDKHGFSITFDTDIAEMRVVSICKLKHSGGHEERNKYAVRIGGGPPGASECQSDGAAYTYAKRGALCAMLNIRVEKPDDDARNEGTTISPEQAEDLKRRVKATNSDEARFLKFAQAANYESIMSAKYAGLDEFLRQKEKKPAASKASPQGDGPNPDGSFGF